ncbi:DUF2252 domain-containing protein [Svornostia abyssi]|uniref:DUF2252 domain-containing protein n=1 Tax=Svornostia abyssi TaxID=2898438 RepID=A0ABY5PLN6_9ACTN|nr:DUF2252 domain-containing protein [Parviterribacteraceae bacterium J379]
MSQPTPEERRLAGRARRTDSPRSSHAAWSPGDDREDPIAILERQAADRVPELLPLRYGRMAASPFAFLRGSAAVMAADIATTRPTGLRVQCCGDAHLSNFGLYASPERRLVFDLNDFDETLPGPFEYDVKRLAASVTVAARGNGESPRAAAETARAGARRYREAMLAFARMRHLDVWYAHADVDAVLATQATVTKRLQKNVTKARGRTSLQAFSKLTETVDGKVRFRDDPPLVTHLAQFEDRQVLEELLRQYRATLPDERRVLADRYELVDIAQKVVSVGSVGTRAFITLNIGRDGDDPLILQAKEATASVLEPHTGRSRYRQQGKRVVVGQRLMQATSDIFLGWLRGPNGRDFYLRQLRDMKGSAEIEALNLSELTLYAELCGWVLARAHARTGDAAAIAGYLGGGEAFDKAMRDWAHAYADQTERDHEMLLRAIDAGRVPAAAA